MKLRRFFAVGIFTFLMVTGFAVHADLETTATLPGGIWSSKITYGVYTGIEDRYDAAGLIEGVADQYHLNLTGSVLAGLDPQLQSLVQTLNTITATEPLGNELSMGTLDFKPVPVVQYWVPTLAYGVSPTFSIGLGIPIVHFQNAMTVVSAGGNVQQLNQFLQGASSQVTSAVSQLVSAAQNMAASLNGVLSSRGYLPIRNVDETVPGDLQISGVWRYYSSPKWHLALRPYIEVPTGQQADADDLMSIAIGGQPAAGLYSIHEYTLSPKVTWISSVGYQANIQDWARMRVPTSLDDILPGQDREDTLMRKTGNSLYLETGMGFKIYHPLTFSMFYDFLQKDPDWYAGSQGWDYDILGVDTGEQIQSVKATLEFSAVDLYRKGYLPVPFVFGYIYGNTLYAVNAPNIISHQLYLRAFF